MHRHHPPRRARGSLLVAIALAVSLTGALAGCGASGAMGGRIDAGPPVPPDDPGPVELPADQVVWVDTGGGGMVAPSPVAPHLASLTIYGDGRVFRVAGPASRHHLDPVPIEVGQVSPEDLAALVRAVEESGLFDAGGADLGDPQVTDLGSKIVQFHSRGEAVELSAYAFDEDFENQLTSAQRHRRATLRNLLEQARAAGADFAPWQPETVAVAELDGRSSQGSGNAPIPWTGPDLDKVLEPTTQYGASGCGSLEGADASAVWTAAMDDPGTTWLVDDVERELVVAALLPGQHPCAA